MINSSSPSPPSSDSSLSFPKKNTRGLSLRARAYEDKPNEAGDTKPPNNTLIEELQRAKDLCHEGTQRMELKACIDRAYVLAKCQERVEGEKEERVEGERDAQLTPQLINERKRTQDVEEPPKTRIQTRQSTQASKQNLSSHPSQSSQKPSQRKRKN